MVEVDMIRRWDEVDPILWGGDGSALFAIEFRRLNPPAGVEETIAEYWQRIDAVSAYQSSVSTWREEGGRGFDGDIVTIVANRDDARFYRMEHPGCAFVDVVAYIAELNRRDGDPDG